MSEIRSTIDIMMERTRGMSLSQEEKEQVRREEFKKRARGLRLRLLESPSMTEEILSSLNGESDEDRTLLMSLLREELVETVPLDETAFTHLELLGKLPLAGSHAAVLTEMTAFLKSRMKSRAQDREKILTREKKRLATFGISGTAVMPKLPQEPLIPSDLLSTWDRWKRLLLEPQAA